MKAGSCCRIVFHPIVVALVIAFLATPPAAFGEMREFVPRIYNNEGELQVGALYDDYKSTSSGRGSETTDAYIVERFVLTTTGFVYHPRFIQFLAQLSIGFNQEKFTQTNPSSSQDDSWSNVFKTEYELRAIVLPEHPYNLDIYTLRKEPSIRGLSAGQFVSVITSSGAIFKYKEKPYNLLLSYDHSDIESRTFTTVSDTFVASGAYTKDWGSFWGSFTHNGSDTSQGGLYPTDYTLDTYGLGNYLNFWERKGRLMSTVTENKLSQNSTQSTVDDDRLSWNEQLSLNLPWNFDVNLNYRYNEDEQTTRLPGRPSDIALWNRNNNAIFLVTQRLYQSLVTSYSYNYYAITSSGGDSTSSSQILTSTYRKMIPRGYLNAGISLGRSITEGNGAPTIINVPANAVIYGTDTPPAGEIPLLGDNIDENSLEILGAVQYRRQAGDFDDLPSVHYQVIRSGNTFRIRILSVPPDALASCSGPLTCNPSYDFQVNYSLLPADYELKTTTFAYSLKLDLFDRFFNPYYNYSRSDREVLSGSFPGGDEKVVVNTVGVSCERPSYTLIAEYQDYDSTLNPSKTFRAEGTAWQTYNDTMTLTGNAYFMNREYTEVPEMHTPGYTERTLGGRVRGDKKFPRQNLTASLAANYWQTESMYSTRSGLINAQLTWKVGQLDLVLGADVARTETDLLVGKQETNHSLYYLSLKRKLYGR